MGVRRALSHLGQNNMEVLPTGFVHTFYASLIIFLVCARALL